MNPGTFSLAFPEQHDVVVVADVFEALPLKAFPLSSEIEGGCRCLLFVWRSGRRSLGRSLHPILRPQRMRGESRPTGKKAHKSHTFITTLCAKFFIDSELIQECTLGVMENAL